MTEHDQLMRDLAYSGLLNTDYRILKAIAPLVASEEWCAWRDRLREIYNHPETATEIPPEPPFGTGSISVRLVPDAPPEQHRFPASLDERLVDYGDPAAEADLTTDDLLTSMRSDAAVTEDVVQRLSRAKRKKFTELLNVELAELQQERSGPKENLKRENEIEALLNLFARVGEM